MRDHTRDYCTAAFKFYCDNGKCVDRFRKKIYKEALEYQQLLEGTCGISKPTEAAIVRAERMVEDRIAEIADMDAVDRTIRIIATMQGGQEVLKALTHVYLDGGELKKGEIERRVHKAEIDIPASRRSIFRWLKIVRRVFAGERGLRF